MEIKDFGIATNGRKDEILCRGFLERDERMVTDEDEPLLELVENEIIGSDEIKKRIKEERKKAKLRVTGRVST